MSPFYNLAIFDFIVSQTQVSFSQRKLKVDNKISLIGEIREDTIIDGIMVTANDVARAGRKC